MKYAVIRLNGRQYKVKEGDFFLTDKIIAKKIEPEVLLFKSESELKVGAPVIDGVKVKLEVVGDEKGKKIHVFKYKAKSRYRKKIGSRSRYTRLKVVSIV